MHLTKLTVAAVLVAGALISQSPAIARADDGASNSSSSCHMSRNVNGNRWSSNDCGEVRQQMNKDMASIASMLDLMAQPSQPAPKAVGSSAESDPVAEHILGSIQAFIQHLLFRLPWLS